MHIESNSEMCELLELLVCLTGVVSGVIMEVISLHREGDGEWVSSAEAVLFHIPVIGSCEIKYGHS